VKRWGALIVLVACLGAAAAPAQVAANAGVYVLNSVASTQALPSNAFSSGYIDGVTLVFYWNAVEPQDGVDDWTPIDRQIAAAAAAGKKVNLGVLPGVFSPAWLYAEGAAQFSMVWTATGWGFPLCSLVPFPLPWDPVYQAKWLAFIQQLGARYGGNKSIAMVKIQGVNSSTPELFLPYSRPTGSGPGPGGCQQIDYVQAWLNVGYRPSMIVSAWGKFAHAFMASFPRRYVILETGAWPLPPITATGLTSLDYGGDWVTPSHIIATGVSLAGKLFVAEDDALSAVYDWPRPANLPLSSEFAYQTAWNVDDDPSCRMNGYVTPCDPATVMGQTVARALANNVTFLEVYATDAEDATEASALTLAHDTLRGLTP
jgi:hypothetical protein